MKKTGLYDVIGEEHFFEHTGEAIQFALITSRSGINVLAVSILHLENVRSFQLQETCERSKAKLYGYLLE